MKTNENHLTLDDLHGGILTVKNSKGERVELTGFTCDDYPDCDDCGHIEKELAEGVKNAK